MLYIHDKMSCHIIETVTSNFCYFTGFRKSQEQAGDSFYVR